MSCIPINEILIVLKAESDPMISTSVPVNRAVHFVPATHPMNKFVSNADSSTCGHQSVKDSPSNYSLTPQQPVINLPFIVQPDHFHNKSPFELEFNSTVSIVVFHVRKCFISPSDEIRILRKK